MSDELGGLCVEGEAIIDIAAVEEDTNEVRVQPHTDGLQQHHERNHHLLTHIAHAFSPWYPISQ